MICPEASALSMKVGSEKTARPPEVNVFLPGYSLEPKWHGLELGVWAAASLGRQYQIVVIP